MNITIYIFKKFFVSIYETKIGVKLLNYRNNYYDKTNKNV